DNQISFVTFNYDISLERSLFKGLDHIELFRKEDISSFINKDRFLHVYGQISEDYFSNQTVIEKIIQDTKKEYGGWPQDGAHRLLHEQKVLDAAYDASETIFTINDTEEEKSEKNNNHVLEVARNKIKDARYVYILGYGFDKSNNY